MDPSLKGDSSTHFGQRSLITYPIWRLISYFLFLTDLRHKPGGEKERNCGSTCRYTRQGALFEARGREQWEARANFNRLSYSTWESRMREASSFSRGRDQHVPLSLTLSLSLSLSLYLSFSRFQKLDISCVTFLFLCRSHPLASSLPSWWITGWE